VYLRKNRESVIGPGSLTDLKLIVWSARRRVLTTKALRSANRMGAISTESTTHRGFNNKRFENIPHYKPPRMSTKGQGIPIVLESSASIISSSSHQLLISGHLSHQTFL
jgi:hypothetical protein